MSSTLGIVKISFPIGLQPHRKLMEMFRHLMIVVKALIKIGFTVFVQIA